MSDDPSWPRAQHVCEFPTSPTCGVRAPAGCTPIDCSKCGGPIFECQPWHWAPGFTTGEHLECPAPVAK